MEVLRSLMNRSVVELKPKYICGKDHSQHPGKS